MDSLHEILASKQNCKPTESLPDNEQPSDHTEDLMETSEAVEEQNQLGDSNTVTETKDCGVQSTESCEGSEGCEEKNTKTSVIHGTLQGTFKSVVSDMPCCVIVADKL